MADSFTFEEAQPAPGTPGTFSFEDAQAPETFTFEQAAGEPSDSELRQSLGTGGFPVARSPEELAAQNVLGQLSAGRSPLVQSLPPGPPTLDVQGTPEEIEPPGTELQRHPLRTLAGVPARIATDAGRALKAGLGDIAANAGNTPEFAGNLQALLRHDEQLPVERAVQLSSEEDRDQHATGWQTISADISLGLADLAPKIALMEAAPAAGVPAPLAAAGVFGFDEASGKFNPKSAAVAAAFPFVTKAAATATDSAIKAAVDRGLTWAGQPGAQRALHVAANQAAMNTIMAAQDAPELIKLSQTDPQEFKRQIAKMIGSNLAFAIPEALQARAPIPRTQNAPPAPSEPAVPVTQDLAEEIQAALRGNQLNPEAPAAAGAAATGPAVPQGLEKFQQTMDELTARRPAPAESLTPVPQGETTLPAAPETQTGGTAPGPETLETPGPSTPAEIAAPLTTESEPIPVEAAGTEPVGTEPPAEPAARSAAGSRTTGAAGAVARRQARPFDLLDEIQGSIGTIDPKLIKEANPDWKPVGAARRIFKAGGTPADVAADALARSGHYKGDPSQVDQFGDAANAAARARVGNRRAAAVENKQNRQDSAFARDVGRPGAEQRPVIAEDLQPGDTLKIRGAPMKVRELEFDDDGRVVGVTLDDGAKYGTQVVEGSTRLMVDNRSFRTGTQPTVTTRTAAGTNKQRVAQAGEPNATPRPAKGKFETWLDQAIENTKPGTAWTGEASMGLGKLPVWLSKEIAHGALKTLRAGLHAGQKLAEAVEGAMQWLRDRKLAGFSEQEARDWINESSTDQSSSIPMLNRRQEINARLAELNALAGRRGQLTDELKRERYILSKESLQLQRALLKDPEYVADLLRRMDEKGRQLDNARKAGNGANARQYGEEYLSLMEESQGVEPELINRVYNDLVARGEIMKSETGPIPAGRTLGELTAWLRSQKLDSPKLSVRERFNLARRAADAFEQGRSALEKAANRVAAGWEAFKEQWRHPPVDDEFRNVIKDWFFQKQWTGLDTHQWVQQINSQIPSPVRRQALSVWLDAGGDENLIRAQADLVPDKYRPIWKAASELTTKEKSLGWRIRAEFEQKLQDASNAGLVDRGRENYGVPQLWETPPKNDGEYDPFGQKQQKPRNPTAKLDPRAPFFSLERTNPSYFDGIMSGGVPKTLDVGKLVGIYHADFQNSLADRTVIKMLKDAKAPDGEPIVKIAGSVRIEPRAEGARVYFVDSKWRPADAVTADGRPYVYVDHWALKDWKFASKDADGNPIVVHGDFLVHPDYARFLKNELGQSWLRDPENGGRYFNWLLGSQAFLKASKFASATFHMATIGEHAIFHAVSPLTTGVELDPVRNPKLAGLMRHGMELGFGSQRELFEEGLASHGGLWGKVPGLGDAMHKMSEYLFKDYIPKIKTKVGLAVLERNGKRYGGPDWGGKGERKLSDQQLYELSAQQVNAGFGVQNWRLLGTNKTLLDVNRLLFTAPDFLLSRSKVVAQALKPYNREQRAFLLAQAAIVYTACRALNLLLDKDPHWEPDNAFSVVYNKRAYSARFLVNDLYYMLRDQAGFAAGRVGPLPKSVFEAFYQRDLRTGARIEVPIETSNTALRAAEIMAKDLAGWIIPVGVEGVLPGAKGKEETGPGQLALSLVGVGSRKYTAQSQMAGLAADFNRNSKDPKARDRQRTQDNEARVESAYRKLDALLDANDLPAAAKEYQGLLKDGKGSSSIRTRYDQVRRPFTGTLANEQKFKASLNKEQRDIYQRAIDERLQRRQRFLEMLRDFPATMQTAGAAP